MKKQFILAIPLFSSLIFGRTNNASSLKDTQITATESHRYITYANELTKGGYSMSVRYTTI